MARNLDAASGRWPELLQALGGLTIDDLCDREGPCPSCRVLSGDAGNTRFKWDDDDGPGGWFCSHCGGKDRQGGGGTGVDLLMRLTGWDFPTAARRVEQHLGLPGAAATVAPAPTAPAPRPRKPKRPHRIPDTPPPGTQPPALGSAVAQFPYGPDRQNPWYWIQRVPQQPKPDAPADAKPPKLFIHRTWLDGAWHHPSRRDGFASEWPAPRPVFNLPDLLDHPDAPVLICEGEGKSISAADLFPDHICIAWTGGTAGIAHTDWSPLAGRTLILWPDADDPGRQCMAKLGQLLLPSASAITIVNPPAGLAAGWDLADAVAEGWTPQRAAKAAGGTARTAAAAGGHRAAPQRTVRVSGVRWGSLLLPAEQHRADHQDQPRQPHRNPPAGPQPRARVLGIDLPLQDRRQLVRRQSLTLRPAGPGRDLRLRSDPRSRRLVG
jgi:putative DNA primase/helicase